MTLTPRLIRIRAIGLLLAITGYLLAFFHRVAPAAIANDLVATFHLSAASLGVLAATYFYVYTIMQVPTGVLADTLGPRKILALGGVVAGVGSLIFGFAPSFAIAVCGRTLVGLGVSVAFIAMLKLIAVWFEESRFATLTGIAMFLGNIGSVVAGAPLAWVAQASGWRVVFIVVGALSLLIGIASWFLVKDSPSIASNETQARTAHVNQGWMTGLMIVLRNPATWPGFFFNFGIAGSFFSFAGLWAVPYLIQAKGYSRLIASNHVSLYFIGFAIGALLIGRFSDHIGRRKPLLLAGAILYAASWLIWIVGKDMPLALTYTMFGVMGLVTSGFTLSWACAKEVNPPALSGMATSVVNAGMFLGAAIAQPLVGWIMDQFWDGTLRDGVRVYSEGDYRAGLLLLFGFAVFGVLSGLFIRETYCRNGWRG
ncbi:MAG: MFS transporter [Pseudomonadota bacterium]